MITSKARCSTGNHSENQVNPTRFRLVQQKSAACLIANQQFLAQPCNLPAYADLPLRSSGKYGINSGLRPIMGGGLPLNFKG